MRRFVRHRLALAGFVTIVVLAFAAGVGPYLNPYNDLHIDILHRFTPPFAGAHVLGTDSLGRDMLARLEMAGRVSLTVGCAAMVISTIWMMVATRIAVPPRSTRIGSAMVRPISSAPSRIGSK